MRWLWGHLVLLRKAFQKRVLFSQGAYKSPVKKMKVLMSPCGCNSPRQNQSCCHQGLVGSTPALSHPSANWVGNTSRMSSAGSHLWKRASRPCLGSCSQRPAGAGGVLAQSPIIEVIRSHLITALLSTTPSTGLAAARLWENHPRCRKETGKLLPFLKEMPRS